MPTPLQPTAALRLAGSKRAEYERDPNEPQPEPTTGEPPAGMTPGGIEHWRRLWPLVEAMGIMGESDIPTLRAACETWAEMEAAQKAIAERGQTYETESGRRYPVPEVAILHRARHDVIKFVQIFGLSPADRSRVAAKPKTGITPEEWAKQRRKA